KVEVRQLAHLEQLETRSDPGRDPRGRVVSVAYYALVKPSAHALAAATDATRAAWFAVRGLPPLAFDHAAIASVALRRLKAKVRYEPIGFELLPPKFTLTRLQALYEAVLERPLDKRNFRKKVLSMGVLVELDERQHGVGRSARLYRFDAEAYQRLTNEAFAFAS
ncbi:MAG TPA: NUDIX hydrolase, partial [Planctomycetaceae bacterium]